MVVRPSGLLDDCGVVAGEESQNDSLAAHEVVGLGGNLGVVAVVVVVVADVDGGLNIAVEFVDVDQVDREACRVEYSAVASGDHA